MDLNKINERELAEDLVVDLARLDDQWLELPIITHKWSILSAKAQLNKDRKKLNIDVVYADQYRAIKDNPTKYGGEPGKKPTEEWTKNAVLLSPDYIDAVEEFNMAKHQVDVINSAVKSIDAKKQSLDALTKLFLGDYFTSGKELGNKVKDALGEKECFEAQKEMLSKNERMG